MSFRSFLSTLREKWSGLSYSHRRGMPKPHRSRLELEALETRLAPAAAVPKILTFTPPDGSNVGTTTTNPTLSVTFSEAMDVNDVQNVANYFIFNSEGQKITIQ